MGNIAYTIMLIETWVLAALAVQFVIDGVRAVASGG
mgnify:CR=1 FL=1